MGWFKKKEQKVAETKEIYRRTVAALEKRESELLAQKEIFTARAKAAKENGSQNQYDFAVSAFRLTVVQIKNIRENLAAFRTALQVQESAESDKAFVTAFADMSKNLQKLTGEKQYRTLAAQYAAAIPQAERHAAEAESLLQSLQQTASVAPSPSDGLEQVSEDWVDEEVAQMKASFNA